PVVAHSVMAYNRHSLWPGGAHRPLWARRPALHPRSIPMRYAFVALLLVPFAFVPSEELWEAAKKGDVKTVEALLAKGVDVNAKTDYGATALHFACDKGNVEVVKLLLKHKADVNAKDTFYSAQPLAWALMKDHAEVVKVLIEAGAGSADDTFRAAALGGKGTRMQAGLAPGEVEQA